MARNGFGNKFLNFIGLVDDYKDEYQPSGQGRPSTIVPPRKNGSDKGRTAAPRTGMNDHGAYTYNGGNARGANRDSFGDNRTSRGGRDSYAGENRTRTFGGTESRRGRFTQPEDEFENMYDEEQETRSAPRRGSRFSDESGYEPPKRRKRSRFDNTEEPAYDEQEFAGEDDSGYNTNVTVNYPEQERFNMPPQRRPSYDTGMVAKPRTHVVSDLKHLGPVIADMVRNRLVIITLEPGVPKEMRQRINDTLAGARAALSTKKSPISADTIMLIPACMLTPEEYDQLD